MLSPPTPPHPRLLDQRLYLCPNLRKVIKVWNSKLICLILNPLLDLMFVTSVPGHIRPNYFKLYPQKQVSKWSQVSFQGTTSLFGELLKVLSFLTQFQENSNYSMSFSRHTRICVFLSSRPKTHAVWMRNEPKTWLSFLFVLYFNSFYLK